METGCFLKSHCFKLNNNVYIMIVLNKITYYWSKITLLLSHYLGFQSIRGCCYCNHSSMFFWREPPRIVSLLWLCCVILGKDNCLPSRKLVSNVTDFFTPRWYFFGRRFFFWQSRRLIYTVNLHTDVFEEILALVFHYILQSSLFAQNDSNTNTVNEYLVYICMEDRVWHQNLLYSWTERCLRYQFPSLFKSLPHQNILPLPSSCLYLFN